MTVRANPITREDFHNKIRWLKDAIKRLRAENADHLDKRAKLLVWLKRENPKLYARMLMELAFPKEEIR